MFVAEAAIDFHCVLAWWGAFGFQILQPAARHWIDSPCLTIVLLSVLPSFPVKQGKWVSCMQGPCASAWGGNVQKGQVCTSAEQGVCHTLQSQHGLDFEWGTALCSTHTLNPSCPEKWLCFMDPEGKGWILDNWANNTHSMFRGCLLLIKSRMFVEHSVSRSIHY